MKYAVFVLALLAATAAQADSLTDPGCFTPQAGFSFITSLPICPATPVVTPPVTQPGEDMDETSDDQGGNNQGEINTTETVSSVPDQGGHFIFENGRLVFAAPAEPVGVPEPSSAWLLVLGLGTVVLAGRKVVYSR